MAAAAPETKTKTYRGNCHCGAYIYDVELPEALSKGAECNCSTCYKRGAVWAMPGVPRFVKGDPASLTSYTFGRKLLQHKFCPTCGVTLQLVGYTEPPKEGQEPLSGVNLRSIQHAQLDFWKLEKTPFDGGSFPPPYQPPEYTGPEPTAEIEGGRLYTGSCHCGAVKVALKSKPLDKSYSKGIFDCNCSHCQKAGATWIIPNKEQVVVQGKENQVEYTFNTRTWAKAFCRTCGVIVDNHPVEMSEERLASLSEEVRARHLANLHRNPFNIRLLNDVRVSDVNVARLDGYSKPPIYEEPQP